MQGYFLPSIPSLPRAEEILKQLNGETLREYWSEPGHTIAGNLLSTFPLPLEGNFEEDKRGVVDSFDEKSLRRFFFLAQSTSSREEEELEFLPNEKEKSAKIDRYYLNDSSSSPSLPDNLDPSSIFLRRNWDLSQLTKLVSTWSGVLDWRERNGGRDLLKEFEGRMIREGGWGDEGREQVELVWSIGGMGGRKKRSEKIV